MLVNRLIFTSLGCVLSLVAILCGYPSASECPATCEEQLNDLPFVIHAEGLSNYQIWGVLEQIDQIPEGAFVQIYPFDESVDTSNRDHRREQMKLWNEPPPDFEIKPFDDPENPYSEQYEEWDAWEYENYNWLCENYNFNNLRGQELSDFFNADHEFSNRTGNQYHWIHVRGDGCLIPYVQLEEAHAKYGNLGTGFGWGKTVEFDDSRFTFNVKSSYSIMSMGIMDSDLWDRMILAGDVAQAPFAPEIPKWLADNPPRWVIFFPDGEVVTLGALGYWNDPEAPTSGTWFRFSSNGVLLDSNSRYASNWFSFYFNDFNRIIHDLEKDLEEDNYVKPSQHRGVIRFTNSKTYETLAYYTYIGEPVDASFRYEFQPLMFDIILGSSIPAMYEAQQAELQGVKDAGQD